MTNQLEALISRAKHIVENGGLLACDTSLALIAALEQSQQQNQKYSEIKNRLCNESNSLFDRLRSAEKITSELNSTLESCGRIEYTRRLERKVAELEVSQLAVKLPDEIIDQVCMAASEIHNRGNGVDDDKAQFIIDRIRNYLESGAAVQGDE